MAFLPWPTSTYCGMLDIDLENAIRTQNAKIPNPLRNEAEEICAAIFQSSVQVPWAQVLYSGAGVAWN